MEARTERQFPAQHPVAAQPRDHGGHVLRLPADHRLVRAVVVADHHPVQAVERGLRPLRTAAQRRVHEVRDPQIARPQRVQEGVGRLLRVHPGSHHRRPFAQAVARQYVRLDAERGQDAGEEAARRERVQGAFHERRAPREPGRRQPEPLRHVGHHRSELRLQAREQERHPAAQRLRCEPHVPAPPPRPPARHRLRGQREPLRRRPDHRDPAGPVAARHR